MSGGRFGGYIGQQRSRVLRAGKDSGSIRSGSIFCSGDLSSSIASRPAMNGSSMFFLVLALVINERINTFGIANSSSTSLICFVAFRMRILD